MLKLRYVHIVQAVAYKEGLRRTIPMPNPNIIHIQIAPIQNHLQTNHFTIQHPPPKKKNTLFLSLFERERINNFLLKMEIITPSSSSNNNSPVLATFLVVLVVLLASLRPASSQNQQSTFTINPGGAAAAAARPGGGKGGGGGPGSFSDFVTQNVQHYVLSEQKYAGKVKALDAELSAAEAGAARYVVSGDGKGKFRTITDAIKAVPEYNKKRVILDIRPGTYK